mgnify:CR=1 FL=1
MKKHGKQEIQNNKFNNRIRRSVKGHSSIETALTRKSQQKKEGPRTKTKPTSVSRTIEIESL